MPYRYICFIVSVVRIHCNTFEQVSTIWVWIWLASLFFLATSQLQSNQRKCHATSYHPWTSRIWSNSFSTDIWLAGEGEVGDIFSNPDIKHRLFPDGRFITILWPLLWQHHQIWSWHVNPPSCFLSGDKSRGTVTAISLISEILCSVGLTYDLEFLRSQHWRCTATSVHLYEKPDGRYPT